MSAHGMSTQRVSNHSLSTHNVSTQGMSIPSPAALGGAGASALAPRAGEAAGVNCNECPAADADAGVVARFTRKRPRERA